MSPMTPREPVAKGPSTTLSQPPSRTLSSHQPTHGREMTPSPEALRRAMSESSLQPSPSSSKIQRANSVKAGWSACGPQVLTPNVQKVLSNPSKPPTYVARFWSMIHTCSHFCRFRILAVGKVRLCKVQQVQVKLIPLSITERLGQIFTHQYCLQGEYIGTQPVANVAIFC